MCNGINTLLLLLVVVVVVAVHRGAEKRRRRGEDEEVDGTGRGWRVGRFLVGGRAAVPEKENKCGEGRKKGGAALSISMLGACRRSWGAFQHHLNFGAGAAPFRSSSICRQAD